MRAGREGRGLREAVGVVVLGRGLGSLKVGQRRGAWPLEELEGRAVGRHLGAWPRKELEGGAAGRLVGRGPGRSVVKGGAAGRHQGDVTMFGAGPREELEGGAAGSSGGVAIFEAGPQGGIWKHDHVWMWPRKELEGGAEGRLLGAWPREELEGGDGRMTIIGAGPQGGLWGMTTFGCGLASGGA